jgi:glycosyltransferase involved in cell wall biosynthesis
MSDIAVVIITKNEENRIRACLDQARKLTDEIIIVDDESTDRTREIALEYGARVIVHHSNGFMPGQRNIGAEQVKSIWFFSMDADEILDDNAIARIREVVAKEDPAVVGAFKIRRLNYFFGCPIRHAGEYSYSLEIFRRDCRDMGKILHENWKIDGQIREIDAKVHHYPFTSIAASLNKILQYAGRESQLYVEKREKITLKEIRNGIIFKSFKAFWKAYIKKQGYKDGFHGFMFCLLHHVLGPVIRWFLIWEEAQKQGKLESRVK